MFIHDFFTYLALVLFFIEYVLARSATTTDDLLGNVTILEKCKARDFLKDCLGQLSPILKHTEHGIPTSKEDVDVLCKAFKTGMKCVDDYSSSCLSNEQKKSIENNVMGAKYTFKFLCDDARFQTEYLKYTTCLRGIKDNWNACANQFVALVKEEFARKNVSKASRLLEICCARHGFINCVLVTTRLKCRKEETLFITRIADTLSNTRVYGPHCKSINVTLCSSAEPCLRAPILLMVSATIVSICKLFYG
ncbi:uncharacterized protein LOC135836368 [Planococcus citri]|uniref:uncharacterized protein LOC135836368 n=1 Tax=Planococcus citri TaxID=170843 RepID=UPI0031F7494A